MPVAVDVVVATVVMGGMASALLLVLVVLPALYCIVEARAWAPAQVTEE